MFLPLSAGEAGAPWCNGLVKLSPLGIDWERQSTIQFDSRRQQFGRDVGAGNRKEASTEPFCRLCEFSFLYLLFLARRFLTLLIFFALGLGRMAKRKEKEMKS